MYSGSGAKILRTTNGGLNWEMQVGPSNDGLNSIYFADTNNGTIVGISGNILITTNGGINWFNQSNRITSEILTSTFFINESIGWVTGYGSTILKDWSRRQSNRYG